MVRYYAVTTAAPYTPATWHGAWDDVASALTRKLSTTKVVSQTSNPVSESSASNTHDAAVLRLVSDALGAGTISGNVDCCFACRDSTGMAASYHLHVWVTQGDSDTERGVLIADYIEAAAAEWTGSTGGIGQQLVAPQAVTPVAVSAGDRLVVEIGYRANNVSSSPLTGRLYFNGNGPDMTPGSTGGTDASWIDVPAPGAPPAVTRRPAPVLIG